MGALHRWTLQNGVLKRRGGLLNPTPVPTFPEPVIPNGTTIVNYTDLAQPGDTLAGALRRLTTPTAVRMPAGLFEIIDFSYSLYGVLATNCLGLLGAGVDKTVIQIRPGSSTHVSDVPVQGSGTTNQLSLIRLSKDHIVTRDLTISGTDQPVDPHTGVPHLYNGFVHYMTTGSQFYNVKVTGIPGDWNSPPGETFAINCYKDTDTVLTYSEVDGFQYLYTNSFNPDGTLQRTKGRRVGGSPCGCNNSHNNTDRGANYHDSLVSGRTFSFSGTSSSMGAATIGVTTKNMRIDRNANWTLASGKKFSGVNHENVYGTVLHDHVDIRMQDVSRWDQVHMTFNSKLGDNADITINEPTWYESYPKFNGMFSIKTSPNTYAGAPQTQLTPPVVVKNGIQLTPVQVTSAPANTLTYDPAHYYVWARNGDS